jgi:hypothetical protein
MESTSRGRALRAVVLFIGVIVAPIAFSASSFALVVSGIGKSAAGQVIGALGLGLTMLGAISTGVVYRRPRLGGSLLLLCAAGWLAIALAWYAVPHWGFSLDPVVAFPLAALSLIAALAAFADGV